MLTHARHADVVVVGAGLAGLCAAHHLVEAGLTVAVLESADQVGGRMATDTVDGFRLDRGNHLLNTSFPELDRAPGLDGLRLRPLSSGVLVRGDGRDYRIGDMRGRSRDGGGSGSGSVFGGGFGSGFGSGFGAWDTGLSTLIGSAARAPIGSALDKARLGAALGRLAMVPTARLLGRPESTTAQALAARGFSPRMVEGFLRPLLTALLCDPDLTTSSRCADLVLRGFARGRLCVPEGGAATVPELMAKALPPGTVHLGERVTSISTTRVTTAEHGETTCRAVVVATDAHAAAALLPGLHVPEFHQVTTVHHAAPVPPLREPALLLATDRGGPVAYSIVASEVDPNCAQDGRAVISSTVLGPDGRGPAELDTAVRAHLAALHGADTGSWDLLAVHRHRAALPVMSAPHHIRRPVRLLGGLYVCGDHRDTSTAQGALHSGRRAATHVLRDLGLPAAPPMADQDLAAA